VRGVREEATVSKLREAARDQSCIRCGKRDGTVVGAHYTGVRRLALGGGFGKKCHDLFIADLCFECHREMDTNRNKETKWEHSEEFLFLIVQTIGRRLEQGKLRIS
jgi:hypothetical protein